MQYTTINTIITKLDYKYFKTVLFLCKKIKLKQWKYFFLFLTSTWNVEKEWKEDGMQFLGLTKTQSHVWKKIIFFSNKCQCQPSKLLKLDSSMDEFGDYILTVNSLINYINEFCIRTRIWMIKNESRSIPRQELSFDKWIQV